MRARCPRRVIFIIYFLIFFSLFYVFFRFVFVFLFCLTPTLYSAVVKKSTLSRNHITRNSWINAIACDVSVFPWNQRCKYGNRQVAINVLAGIQLVGIPYIPSDWSITNVSINEDIPCQNQAFSKKRKSSSFSKILGGISSLTFFSFGGRNGELIVIVGEGKDVLCMVLDSTGSLWRSGTNANLVWRQMNKGMGCTTSFLMKIGNCDQEDSGNWIQGGKMDFSS